jgi:hypothetical protein
MIFRSVLMCSAAAMVVLAGCDKKDGLSEKDKALVAEIAKEQFEKILKEEPEKLFKAIETVVQKQQQQAAKNIEVAATGHQKAFWESKLVIGNKDAKVKICVFIDPREPVSQKFREDVMEPIVKERSDVGFFLIPVSIYAGDENGSGQSSLLATQAIIAASWQNPEQAVALWSKIPAFNKEVTRTTILKMAEGVGLSREKLEKDMEGQAAREALIENGKLAVQLGMPPQLPVIFIRKTDGDLEIIPPFVKDKMVVVLDAVRDGKPWEPALAASVKDQPAQIKGGNDEAASDATESEENKEESAQLGNEGSSEEKAKESTEEKESEESAAE